MLFRSKKERVPLIAQKLNELDIAVLLKKFSMTECKRIGLYPDIWDYEEEKEEIIDGLKCSFEGLKKFYNEAVRAGQNVLVSIY